jgi:hypothetical protein
MARIIFLRGSSAGPFGDKTDHLERYGHHLVGRPRSQTLLVKGPIRRAVESTAHQGKKTSMRE